MDETIRTSKNGYYRILGVVGEKFIHKSFRAPETPNFNWGRRRAVVCGQSKWLSPLVFCRSNADAPRRDLGAVTSVCCSASDGSGLVARVNQRNGLLGMRSRTRDLRPISRGLRSDLCRSRM